jgi:hypothetical protein
MLNRRILWRSVFIGGGNRSKPPTCRKSVRMLNKKGCGCTVTKHEWVSVIGINEIMMA